MVLRRIFGRRQQVAPSLDAVTAALEAGRVLGLAQARETYQSASDFDTTHTNYSHSTREREAYEHHPLFTAAVNTITSLVMGTGVTYGQLDDEAAYEALEQWYALNNLADYSTELFRQWLLDGELLALLALNGSRFEPAWMNAWDTRLSPPTINRVEGNPRVIASVDLGDRRVLPDGFVWRSNAHQWNDRGRSPVATAVTPAKDYTSLLEYRLRAHGIRARLNAVYYAIASSQAELQTKADRYKTLPKTGNVVTLQMDAATGQSEKLEFLSTKTDAADAESDVRALIRTVAMVFGIPEHFMAVGDTANLATAKAMSEPMIRRVEEHQALITGVLRDLFRLELKRRYGPTRTYRVNTVQVDGLTRTPVTRYVTADELEIPFALPPARDDTGTNLTGLQWAHDRGLVSDQTAVEELGFDPALEAERKANDTEEEAESDDPIA